MTLLLSLDSSASNVLPNSYRRSVIRTTGSRPRPDRIRREVPGQRPRTEF